MCGIAGFISLDPDLAGPEGERRIRAMLSPLAARGPDGEGVRVWQAGEQVIGLGHRRLAILDLSDAAAQPMRRSETTVVYNGEIYDYLEHRGVLQSKGKRFETRSDTEVLLAALDVWGEDAIGRLNGMFAFAAWNGRQLLCARDRTGEKPFHYFTDGRVLVFASEIESLLAFGSPVPRALRAEGVVEFFRKTYQPLSECGFFEGIRELLPGHRLCAEVIGGQLRVATAPYHCGTGIPTETAAPTAGELRGLFDDAVRLRLRSDVPIGTCVSGGIDSPSIAAAVSARAGTEAEQFRYIGIHAFVNAPEADERAFVRGLAARLGLWIEEVEVTGNGLKTELDELILRQGLPFLSPSVYAQRCVFRRARELGLKVMLDGQGADELFGGYDWAVPRAIAATLRAGHPLTAAAMISSFTGKRFPLGSLLRQSLGYALRRREGEFPDELQAALRASVSVLSLPTLLRYADRNSMSFGVEVRLPFLDPRLIALASRLRPEQVASGGWTKRLLREAMADRLPAEILGRRDKTAFAVPTARWVREDLRDAVGEALEDPVWREWEWSGRKAFLRAAREALDGGPEIAAAWKALCAVRWKRLFFG